MMGYQSGTVQRMPSKGKRGQIVSDDGTLFTFSLPTDIKHRITSGGRVIFVAGSRKTARDVKISRSSHTRVGKPTV